MHRYRIHMVRRVVVDSSMVELWVAMMVVAVTVVPDTTDQYWWVWYNPRTLVLQRFCNTYAQ